MSSPRATPAILCADIGTSSLKSALSIENGSAPVEVPDFTRGAWNKVRGFRHAYAQ